MSAQDAQDVTNNLSEELKTKVDRGDPDDLEKFLTDRAHLLPEHNSLAREVRDTL